jgi:hypothetical protein
MSRCERCGVGFDPPAGLHEVTSCRILCPACDLDRAHARHPSAPVPVAHAVHRTTSPSAHGRSPEPAAVEGHAGRRRAHAAKGVGEPVLGPVAEEHRRRLLARQRRQTLLGLLSVVGVLAAGAIALVLWLRWSGEEQAAIDVLGQDQIARPLAADDLRPDSAPNRVH